jgi:hypothetical protein
MKKVKVFLSIFGVLLSSMLLLSCGIGGPSASSTTGTITGKVLDDNGKPLGAIHDEEVLVVALFCFEDNPNVECLQKDFWDIKLDILLDSICEEDEIRNDCLVYLGKNAASVDTNGRYTITDVPPGEFGLVLIYKGYNTMGTSLKRDLDPVEAGKVTKFDIETELIRK